MKLYQQHEEGSENEKLYYLSDFTIVIKIIIMENNGKLVTKNEIGNIIYQSVYFSGRLSFN